MKWGRVDARTQKRSVGIKLWSIVFGGIAALAFPDIGTADINWVHHGSNGKLIVFIHGLWGDKETSFGDWPNLMKSESDQDRFLASAGALSKYSIVVMGYGSGGKDSLNPYQISSNLLSDLDDLLQQNNFDELIIIAHSLGGIITQKILAESVTAAPLISRSVKRVFLLGVPARGSSLANLASMPVISSYMGPLVQWLRTIDGNLFLQDLQRQWDNLRSPRHSLGRFALNCIYESVPVVGVINVIVVAEVDSVRPCDDRHTANKLDHMQIAKPEGRQAVIYLWVRTRILRPDNR